ncbi:MAG: imidazole glycerol phosphate synthase subunit HisH [Phycisphaerales bacterium]|jgi:imidazole glycerol-phosphate synthase subunit HisH|nr:imidazole glycerol phosphate synthase subunit HisH [Phycisphaerales bacterium]
MIGIIDYGMGNIRSVQRALERAEGKTLLVDRPEQLAGVDKIVLPGVAAFEDAMIQLRTQELLDPIVAAVKSGTPYLGFCLGLQLLFETSYENGVHQGMGLLPGKVVRFDLDDYPSTPPLRVPHMGWNRIEWENETNCPMLEGLNSGQHVYFAHSYCVVPSDENIIATSTEYGYNFTSAVWKDNIFATQFHPEKSQSVGLRLLQNFVKL